MILISHRGNTNGPNDTRENNPYFMQWLIDANMNIEIDLWKYKNELYLGHDEPQYKIDSPTYLKYKYFWIHAKNLDALEYLTSTGHKYFWHQEDDFTLTSNNKIWTYPNKDATKQSIVVCNTLDECIKYRDQGVYGICSDYIGVITPEMKIV